MESNLEGILSLGLIFHGIVFLRMFFQSNKTSKIHLWIAILFFAGTLWLWYQRWTEGLLWVEFEFMLYYLILFGFIWFIWKIIKRIKSK